MTARSPADKIELVANAVAKGFLNFGQSINKNFFHPSISKTFDISSCSFFNFLNEFIKKL